jgi:hypothetical protein
VDIQYSITLRSLRFGRIGTKSAPHPPFGHLLPAGGEKDTSASFSSRHEHGEAVPLSPLAGRGMSHVS